MLKCENCGRVILGWDYAKKVPGEQVPYGDTSAQLPDYMVCPYCEEDALEEWEDE